MAFYRGLIIVGQLGRIWSKKHLTRQLFQSATSIGFYGLMTRAYREREEYDSDITFIGSKKYVIHNDTVENKPKPLRLKKLSTWE